MVDLEDLTNALVDALRRVPELVAALGGDPMRIMPYIDNNPDFNSLSAAAYEQEPGSVLVGWDDTQITEDEMPQWLHNHLFYVRAQRKGVSALRLVTLLVNGVPDPGDGQRWRFCPVMEGVYRTEIPSIERIQDSEGVDYFAVHAATKETGDE